MQKLIPGFQNHMRNLDNFRQAVESPKSWNSMGYICLKTTFFHLKHYLQIYLTLLSTTSVKIHQIPYAIFETMSFFTTQLIYIILGETLHTFDKKYPIKFLDFLPLKWKFIKFIMSFFKQTVSCSLKFGSLFRGFTT